MERWLSLTFLDSPSSEAPRVQVHISIPKRTVKLAVARNRLRRVLREAVRSDVFFGRAGVYRIRVDRAPEKADLTSAKQALEALHG